MSQAELFYHTAYHTLIQLYDVLRQESAKGDISSECASACRHTIMNLRLRAPQILGILASHLPKPAPLPHPEAKNQIVSGCARG